LILLIGVDGFFIGSYDLNITPNFVTESNTMASLHPKVSGVSSLGLRSLKFNHPDVVRINLHLMSDLYRLCF